MAGNIAEYQASATIDAPSEESQVGLIPGMEVGPEDAEAGLAGAGSQAEAGPVRRPDRGAWTPASDLAELAAAISAAQAARPPRVELSEPQPARFEPFEEPCQCQC